MLLLVSLMVDLTLPFGLSFSQLIPIFLIGVVLIIISFILFRRYTSALVFDFVISPLLSFGDEFFGGIVGLDFGNWISAFIGYRSEKKICGKLVALFVAWEASAFFPISLIPVVGTIVEFFTNLFPTKSICRMLFNKYRPAKKQQQKIEKMISIAEQVDIKVSKEKDVLEKVKKLIKKANPVGALKEIKKPIEELSSKLTDYANELIFETQGIIQNIASQKIQAPQELINMMQEGINGSWQLLQEAQNALENEKDKDFESAINSATNAKTVIIYAAQQFYDAFQQYQNEPQQ